jgi:hypothetical protein
VLDSCFTEASFAMTAAAQAAGRPRPELSSPQAVTVELTAIFIRFLAAFTSRCRPDAGKRSVIGA